MPRLRSLLAASVLVVTLGACSPSEIAAWQRWHDSRDSTSVVEDEISQAFGPAAGSATGVARCESNLDPSAISRGGGNWGLFQINSVHAGDFEDVTGRPWSDVLDAHWNAVYAKHLYDDQGWRPWACRWAA